MPDVATLKRLVPPPLRRVISRRSARLRSLWSFEQLRRVSPGLARSIERPRIRRFLDWIQRRAPDDYKRLKRKDLPDVVRQRVLRKFASAPYENLYVQTSAMQPIDTAVLYVTALAAPDVIKEVIALRRVTPDLHCTLLTASLGHVERLSRQYFDRVTFFSDLVGFVRWIKLARARVMILRLTGGMGEFFVPARLFWDGRLIYRPHGFAVQAKSLTDIGWPGWTGEEVFAAEKFFVENVDGIFHFFSPAAAEQLRSDGVNITCPVETIYPACVSELGPHRQLEKLSEGTGEIHLVYAAGISGRDASATAFQLWEKWRAIVSQGIHLHVYVASGVWGESRFVDYRQLAEDSSYFHLEDPVEFDDLLVALTQYDYALQHWDFRLRLVKPGFKYHLSNNFWTYIQAGLPVVVSDTTPGQVELVSKHGIGVIVSEDAIGRLRPILERQDKAALDRRVMEAAGSVFQFQADALWKLVMGTDPGAHG